MKNILIIIIKNQILYLRRKLSNLVNRKTKLKEFFNNILIAKNHIKTLPNLPKRLDTFHNNIIVRIVRFILGINTLIWFFSLNHLIELGEYRLIVAILTIIHLLYILLISIGKIIMVIS